LLEVNVIEHGMAVEVNAGVLGNTVPSWYDAGVVHELPSVIALGTVIETVTAEVAPAAVPTATASPVATRAARTAILASRARRGRAG
jgi:hypothetical protein